MFAVFGVAWLARRNSQDGWLISRADFVLFVFPCHQFNDEAFKAVWAGATEGDDDPPAPPMHDGGRG
jgi:hypothetical protein